MNKLLVALLVLMSSQVAMTPVAAKPFGTVSVRILAVDNFHGRLVEGGNVIQPDGTPITAGGTEYLATHVNNLRANHPHTVVVSAGDLIGASPLLSALFHDEPTIEAFNLIGLDYNAVGQHEFDEGVAELRRMQEGGCHPIDGCQDYDSFDGADFRFLAANVIRDDNGKTLFPAYKVRSFAGAKIAFIGITLKRIPTLAAPPNIAGLTFNDEAETVNALVPALKAKGIETIVVLISEGGFTTGSYNECLDISGPIVDIVNGLDPAVDVVITGYAHQGYTCNINGMLVTSAYAWGRMITAIDLTVDRSSGDAVSMSANNVIVTRDVPPEPLLSALVSKYEALAPPLANRVIGSITADITRARNAAGESALGDVVADSQLAATADPALGGSVVAFMNAGSMRADLFFAQSGSEGDGNVTYAEAYSVEPFGNHLVTMTLTGEQIDTALEQQFAGCGSQNLDRHLQVSAGFTYSWSAAATPCNKVDIASIMINGVPIDPAAAYRITVNDFLGFGGENFLVFTEGTDRLGGGEDLDAFEAYFQANSPVPPGPQNRITVLP